MLTVGSYQAKTRLAELLRRVEEGERITITKHGVPIAKLVPHAHEEEVDLDEVVQEIKRFGERHSLQGLSLKEMIHEGHKY